MYARTHILHQTCAQKLAVACVKLAHFLFDVLPAASLLCGILYRIESTPPAGKEIKKGTTYVHYCSEYKHILVYWGSRCNHNNEKNAFRPEATLERDDRQIYGARLREVKSTIYRIAFKPSAQVMVHSRCVSNANTRPPESPPQLTQQTHDECIKSTHIRSISKPM